VPARNARILTITDSPSLVIGLTLLPNDWEVESRTTIDDDLDGGDVLVLDVGGTRAGLTALGLDGGAGAPSAVPALPTVVIGDVSWPHELPGHVILLLRPYVLSDLAERIEHLLENGIDGVPWTRRADGSVSEVDVEVDLSAGEQPITPAEVDVPIASATVIDVTDQRPGDEQLTGAAHASSSLRSRIRASVSSSAAKTATVPPTGLSILESRPSPRLPQTPDTQTAEPRLLARRRRRTAGTEKQLRERLSRVLTATAELERLLDEVPQLASIPELATVIVEIVADRLEADTVGLWRSGDRGWTVQAHHGLTPHQAAWVVPFDHPLFSEVHRTGGSLLIFPVDQAAAAVAGIGGAFTESFMAVSVGAGEDRYGIIAVGRDQPLTGDDLDTVSGFALEAAIGLAVAEHLQRLQQRPVGPGEDPAPQQRSWHRTET
jgi:hypothetical protein